MNAHVVTAWQTVSEQGLSENTELNFLEVKTKVLLMFKSLTYKLSTHLCTRSNRKIVRLPQILKDFSRCLFKVWTSLAFECVGRYHRNFPTSNLQCTKLILHRAFLVSIVFRCVFVALVFAFFSWTKHHETPCSTQKANTTPREVRPYRVKG